MRETLLSVFSFQLSSNKLIWFREEAMEAAQRLALVRGHRTSVWSLPYVVALQKPTPSPIASRTLACMTTRIHLVEDNPVARSALTDALHATELSEVVSASGTEKEATAWLGSNPDAWDLAVIDLMLPQGSGFSALQKIRKARGQRVVVVTNLVTPEVRERCLAWGADAVFDKVQDLDALLTYCGEPR